MCTNRDSATAVPVCLAAFVVGMSALMRDMHVFGGALLSVCALMITLYPSIYDEESKRFIFMDFLGVVYVAWLLGLSE
jgi:hypothetical protein